MFDKSILFRVCLAPNGQGRGAYICRNTACITQAKKTKGLERTLKKAVPATVYDQLMEEIECQI
ncbi:MAG: YlxR family protein [Defluviitaleaceae bacterium]|nr:YlxR family protein [Defluviitaleaceae bacterium]MCL2275952.1 YlxR family protein [Defluviitaleaceae bacterium]